MVLLPVERTAEAWKRPPDGAVTLRIAAHGSWPGSGPAHPPVQESLICLLAPDPAREAATLAGESAIAACTAARDRSESLVRTPSDPACAWPSTDMETRLSIAADSTTAKPPPPPPEGYEVDALPEPPTADTVAVPEMDSAAMSVTEPPAPPPPEARAL